AARGREVLQRADQPAGRAGLIAPPAVGPAADHVVAVDDDPPIGHAPLDPGLGRHSGAIRSMRPARAADDDTAARCAGTSSTSAPATTNPGRGATSTRARPATAASRSAAESSYHDGSHT